MLNWHSFGTKIEIGGGEGIILDVHLVSIYDLMLGEFWSHKTEYINISTFIRLEFSIKKCPINRGRLYNIVFENQPRQVYVFLF